MPAYDLHERGFNTCLFGKFRPPADHFSDVINDANGDQIDLVAWQMLAPAAQMLLNNHNL